MHANHMKPKNIIPLLVYACAFTHSVWGAVKPNALFSDNAVLQQGRPVPVWGTAAPDEQVTVEFAGQKKTVAADAQGRWKVTLDPMPASAETRVLLISSQVSSFKFQATNVLVGEVWMCAGQSNMNNGFDSADTAAKEKPLANYPQLREFHVTTKSAIRPVADLGYDEKRGGYWRVCSPTTVGYFGAISYFFGRDVHKATRVPVGLIRAAIGGTAAQCWTSLEGLQKEPTLSGYVDQYQKEVSGYDEAAAKYPQAMAEFQAQYKAWQNAVGKAYLDEVKTVDEANKKGQAEGKPVIARPAPPVPPPKQPRQPGGGAGTPALLFNGMIAPVIPYAIKGAIWYQGEANSSKGLEYRTLFPRLIADWREKWGVGDFPFLFVQICPFKGMTPEIREAQFLTSLNTTNTAMAVTVDVGMANDIHPPFKEPIGARLALGARALAYREKIEYSGPAYDAFKIEKNKMILSFKHVGGGLMAKDGPLKGFTLAGADKKFFDAKAEIVGDTVVVTSDQVVAPVAARYGWANVPDVNLWNKAGLPASPFRTDTETINTPSHRK
jgi:sialate O-acetylesterase